MEKHYKQSLAEMGVKIVARREELGMTATELAIYADISSVALSHIEAGQSVVKIDTLIRIASALKVPLSSIQPAELDIYSDVPTEFLSLMRKLKKKSPAEQKKIFALLTSMIEVI